MKSAVCQEVTKQLVKRFLMQIFLYAIFVLLVSAVGYVVCDSRIWYDTDPWYPVLHVLHRHWTSAFFFTLLFGCVVISCIHFYQIARMMEQVVQAVDDMSVGRVNSVVLPVTLHEVEKKMNQIMNQVRQSEFYAKEAEQRKNEMIIYMAHDLKTPLTSVIGYLTLLKDETEIPEHLRQRYLDVAWNKAGRLEELVNEFFEVTRLNFSHMILEYSTVNMSMMLEQILYEFKPLFQQKGLEYCLEGETDLMVSCDIEKMERVFDNLIKNAINYSYENSEIRISLKAHGENGMEMTMKNHGKTIPKEKLEILFEQFFRLDSSRDSKTGGTGLGLAIAKQIMELHHGSIRCDSENETITFLLVL
ncbi:MAG: HAMP domain-containing histidine kinase [Lachnospiraceae bacterium]|nr:HAMP domain-containing histidine kinase [Lachnospiraceae bacterium]